MTLSKTELLDTARAVREGTSARESVRLPSLDVDVDVRPLTHGEAERVRAAQTRGLVARAEPTEDGERPTMTVDIDLEPLSAGQAEAERVAARFGLSVGEDRWTDRDLEELPDGDVRAAGSAAMRLTGIDSAHGTAEGLTATFR